MAAPSPIGADSPYLVAMPHIARLTSRALVRVAGPDARSFLNNLLTQEVEGLAEGEVRFGALLSPPGKLLFDLFIVGQADGVLLDVAAERREALMQRLAMYRLRAQLEIAEDDRAVLVSWPEVAEGFVADPRTALLGGRRYGGDMDAMASEADWQAHRLDVGIPDPTTDTVIDKTYPIEANFDLLNGIAFDKGCFVGQETTSRMKRRGTIKNRMLPLDHDGPPLEPGAEVLNGDLRAGEVMGVSGDGGGGAEAGGRAIAMLRLDRLEGPLTAAGRPVRVTPPRWAPGLLTSAGPD